MLVAVRCPCGCTTQVDVREGSLPGGAACPVCGTPFAARTAAPGERTQGTAGFAIADPKPSEVAAAPPAAPSRETLIRWLDGLVATTVRAVQALEGKLTPDETERIRGAVERARSSESQPNREDLEARLGEMEDAATIIGKAMLRP